MKRIRISAVCFSIFLSAGLAGCESIETFHAEPYEPYVGGIPEVAANGPAHLYLLRFLPETELIYTSWRDKLGAVDITPEGYPRRMLPEQVMSYKNRIEWTVRHDELIQIPFGSMLAAKAYKAIQRFYQGEMVFKGDLEALSELKPNLYAHQIVVEVDALRFFEHPLNHLTMDMQLKMHVFPAGAVEPEIHRYDIIERNVRLGGFFTRPEEFLSRSALMIDHHLNKAFAGFLPELPVHQPIKPVQAFFRNPNAEQEPLSVESEPSDVSAPGSD